MIYRGDKTKEISFPLGGIGSGCIGMAGNGALIDWEIFNKPNKGSDNGYSHFSVKAEAGGKVRDARVLIGDLLPPYTGSNKLFGFGTTRYTMQGFPHFKAGGFIGEFPFATITFQDQQFPGRIVETAFNPFIPLNDKDSSIPAAFFRFEIKNTTRIKQTYTIAGMLYNPSGQKAIHRLSRREGISILHLGSTRWQKSDVEFGSVAIGTDAHNISYQQYAYRRQWGFGTTGVYWRDFTRPGKFVNRSYPEPATDDATTHEDYGILAAHIEVEPGKAKQIQFVISWNYPNMTNYWNPEKCDRTKHSKPKVWRNYYATVFNDATDSARYSLEQFDRLYTQTLKFKQALFASTIPPYVLDAVSANLSTLKSPTVLRLEDGSLYGFEGCACDAGCGEGSCTHVWNYAYALPFLFPRLERSMRDLEYRYTMRKDGKMTFRLQLPIGRAIWDWHACADGQFGGVIKSYRDWKISGNDAWLKSNWKAIKKTIEFAWAKTNEDKWDFDKDGVLEGRQHHTLDTELFGPNSYLTGFYLAALKAGAEMAEYFGEMETAKEYRRLFERGKKWVEANLFNGEYFHQKINIRDKSLLNPYRQFDKKFGSVEDLYWNNEHKQLRHQAGNGCHCDQVVAQWHANLCGLGEIFDRKKVRKALRSIYRNNFKKTMRTTPNPCRLFALNDESALIICDWPKGGKPVTPLTYAEEAMNGFEYQAAIHMIQEGLIKEGLEVVKAIRDRYDGEKRNPWNEFEAGSNYVRSMASFAIMPALAGFQFDMVKKQIGFAPVINETKFSVFWSLEGAWGTYKRSGKMITLSVEAGELQLKCFSDSSFIKAKAIKCRTGTFQKKSGEMIFDRPIRIKAGERIQIETE